MKGNKEKLQSWQERLSRNQNAWETEVAKMDGRELIYKGSAELLPVVEGDTKETTPHRRNIAAEVIESQINSSIPQPKVTARRKEDENLAKLIEDMIRNELDRLPTEEINDIQERTVPIQGGGLYHIEWDNSKHTHTSIGEVSISVRHPKQFVPQDGVFSAIEDMDFVILKIPTTKEYIKRRYGVDVRDENEAEPEIKSAVDTDPANDLVTQYIGYMRNDSGGIDLYSWVNDTELEDLEDYQARRLRKCTKCGLTVPADIDFIGEPTYDGTRPEKKENPSKNTCPYCGGRLETAILEYEEIYEPVTTSNGKVIPGAETTERSVGVDENGVPIIEIVREPTKIPYYKPDMFPLVLQKNVSVFGQLLGDSDIDKISDQQNTTNRLEAKIIDKLCKGGSYLLLPPDTKISTKNEEVKVIHLKNPADKAMIDVMTVEANVSQDLVYLGQVYEEARQIIGITDSFQGRKDSTATSGKAKEFAAAQTAGRLESKRVMKNAAYAALFEAIFKFKLAYADEPRPVVSKDVNGNAEYKEFNRYDFLEQDAAGQWYWNDQFLFSTDDSAPLASNREAMWQETRMNLQTGAFGDPTSLLTLILFWTKMELLHYPGASETKKHLEEELAKQQAAEMQQQAVYNRAQEDALAASLANKAATGQMPVINKMPNMGEGGTML